METFLLNLLKTSLLGSLAVLTMLALKPLWRERYRAKTRCWLWLCLAVFLLLPVDFSLENAPVQAAPPKDYTLFVGTDKTTVMATDNLFGDMAESSGQTPAEVRDAIIERPVTNPEQKTTRYIPVTALLFGGYLAGAAAFLLYQGGCYVHFRRTVRRWKRDVARADYAAMLSDTARDLGVSAPEMIVCEAVTTPAVTGLLRPRLLLPHERYDVQELRYILRHELCHLKRRDMLFKLVLLAANAMHWFNPIVYLMLRQADEDIELACDSAATDDLDRTERAAYSRTLLAAVQSNVRTLPATTCFGGTVERLKRRITNVLGAQKKRGQPVWERLEKSVVGDMVPELPPGEHDAVVGRSLERARVRHRAARLARVRDAPAGCAFRLLRLREQDGKEGEVKVQGKAGRKAVLSPELVAQPAVNGLKELLVMRAQPLFGGADITEHRLRTGARW